MKKSALLSLADRYLSGSVASLFVVLTAIAGRCIQLLFFYNIRVDASYQVMATDNFLHGHGISTGQVLADNLAQTVYTPLTQWPPGYSLLLAPFYALFQHRYIPAGIALDMVAAVALIIFLRKILFLLQTPRSLINLFTLLNGFFIYYFYFIASSDAIAISFFVMGLYFTLCLFKTEKRFYFHLIALVLTLFLAGLIKYLFIPVVFVVPAFLLVFGYLEKKSNLKKAGYISFLSLAFSLGGLLLNIKQISGSVAYISSPQRGIFFHHLTEIYPFLTAAFIKPDTLDLIGGGVLSTGFVYSLSQWATLLLAVVICVLLFQQAQRTPLRSYSLGERFFLLCFLLSLFVTLVLVALSLVVSKEEILPGYFWTYVEEPRYYGLVYVLIHLCVFVFYRYQREKTGKSPRWLFALFLLLLLPEFFRGVLFDLNRVRNFGKEVYSWQYEKRVQDYADSLVQTIRRKEKDTRVVVAGSSYYFNHRISLASHVPILYDSVSLNRPGALKTKAPVNLLVVLDETTKSFQPFLNRNRLQPIGKFDRFLFYTVYVQPE